MQVIDFQSSLGLIQCSLNASGDRMTQILLPGRATLSSSATRHEEMTIRVTGPVQRLITDIQLYLQGEPTTFSLEALDLDRLSPFQCRVLMAAREIPRGRVASYGEIAAAVGQPGAARAVGRALAANPFPVVLPCHRVIRADGGLGGFTGGVSLKRMLLDLEQAREPPHQ